MVAVLYSFHHEQVRIPERRSVMKRLVMLRDGGLKTSRLSRPLLWVLVAATLGIAAPLGIFAATPASAYGKENWHIAVSGTGVNPGPGQGFGFWAERAFGCGDTPANHSYVEI